MGGRLGRSGYFIGSQTRQGSCGEPKLKKTIFYGRYKTMREKLSVVAEKFLEQIKQDLCEMKVTGRIKCVCGKLHSVDRAGWLRCLRGLRNSFSNPVRIITNDLMDIAGVSFGYPEELVVLTVIDRNIHSFLSDVVAKVYAYQVQLDSRDNLLKFLQRYSPIPRGISGDRNKALALGFLCLGRNSNEYEWMKSHLNKLSELCEQLWDLRSIFVRVIGKVMVKCANEPGYENIATRLSGLLLCEERCGDLITIQPKIVRFATDAGGPEISTLTTVELNSQGTAKLYNKIINLVEQNGNNIVYELNKVCL
jgi:hypothetical protein